MTGCLGSEAAHTQAERSRHHTLLPAFRTLAIGGYPHVGGGDSIAICGLAAGVLVTQLVGRDRPVRWAADAVLYYIVALAGWGLVGIVGAGPAVVAAVVGLWLIRRIDPAGGYRLVLAATGLCALGLAALRDLHGAALTAAMLLTVMVLICRNWVGTSG